jgi:hypothetical protein
MRTFFFAHMCIHSIEISSTIFLSFLISYLTTEMYNLINVFLIYKKIFTLTSFCFFLMLYNLQSWDKVLKQINIAEVISPNLIMSPLTIKNMTMVKAENKIKIISTQLNNFLKNNLQLSMIKSVILLLC